MALKYRNDDIFIGEDASRSLFAPMDFFFGGGGVREHVHMRENVPGEIFTLHREFK